MATALEIITSARFDIRDEDSTQYSDAMLLDFINRGLRALTSALAMLRSDWVNSSTTLTQLIATDEVALPAYFVSDIKATLSGNMLVKMRVSAIRAERIINSGTTGKPYYYAIQGSNMLFDRVSDAEYSIILEFNLGIATLVTTDTMPFESEFDDVLRQFVILCAKSRNEFIVLSDAAMQDFFYDAIFSKLVARNFIPNQNRTNF